MGSKVFMYILIVPTVLGKPLIPTNKLSLATWGSYYHQDHMGPGTYAFGYDIEDPVTGNIQFKQEERHLNGTVTGNYGYVDADGKPHVVTYIADENGYRAKIEIEGELVKYFPDVSGFFRHEEIQNTRQTSKPAQNHIKHENIPGTDVKQNPLTIPLQGEVINPQIPIIYRLNYPSYYKYIEKSSLSK